MNRSQKLKLVGAALLLAGLFACDKPGPAETAGKNIDRSMSQAGQKIGDAADKVAVSMAEQRNKAGVAMDDTEITTKVKAAIFAEPGLRTLQISVDTVNGVVTLSGSVDTKEKKELTNSLASAVDGVNSVNNQLVIKSGK
ncbi:MAG: BON domain-containing protein [Sideroxyarcus sp.]|nr:BON domain-containing protein [Sideroxyarcus sp.]